MHKDHLHTDPLRLPKIQEPLENKLIKLHSTHQSKMMVDITKELVKISKEKK